MNHFLPGFRARLLLCSVIMLIPASCTPPDTNPQVCAAAGGTYEMRIESLEGRGGSGDATVAYCVFSDRSECQAYQFRIGQCHQGQIYNVSPAITVTPSPTYPPVDHNLIFFTRPTTATLAPESMSSIKGVLGLAIDASYTKTRCLMIGSAIAEETGVYNLVWPPNFRYQWTPQDNFEILNERGQIVAKWGQMLLITGQKSTTSFGNAEAETICPGPYWLVGDQITESN